MALGSAAKFLEEKAFAKLNNALSGFHSDESYAIPNRFEVLILPPRGASASMMGEARKVSLRCESLTIPGRNLTTLTDSNIYGPTREIVDGVTYAEDIEMVFQSSGGLDERVFFESWQELTFNPRTWNIGYYNDYIGTVEIYMLDRQDTKRYGVKLWEAFPKTITGTELSQASNNEIVKTSVSFSFRYWETLDLNRQPPKRNDLAEETGKNTAEITNKRNQPATVSLYDAAVARHEDDW